ncbi:hypothetical protein ACL6C3_17670 [Capilliphycus salinus ALCB114379]|uniref:hypothetical protein n=1 Tax=Capilliphycus salinus TaxID=2768948 RepID=UPI0039A72A18
MKITQHSLSLPSDSFSGNNRRRKGIEEKLSYIFSQTIRQTINFLVGSSEPKIWQTQTKTGDLIWHIYDPITGKTEQFISDQDVRIWIEKQYYR